MFNKVRNWVKANPDLVMMATAVAASATVVVIAVKAMSTVANLTGEDVYEDIDWNNYDPERPQEIQLIIDGECVYDNLHNNDMITNALRLANAVVDGKRDPEWAMPIIKGWLEEVQ